MLPQVLNYARTNRVIGHEELASKQSQCSLRLSRYTLRSRLRLLDDHHADTEVEKFNKTFMCPRSPPDSASIDNKEEKEEASTTKLTFDFFCSPLSIKHEKAATTGAHRKGKTFCCFVELKLFVPGVERVSDKVWDGEWT